MKTGQALIDEINALELPQGAAAFWWLGQISYIVKVGDAVLYFDPYLVQNERRLVPPLLRPEEVSNADWVFCSHDHSDHLDRPSLPSIAAASPQARFVCSRVARQTMLSLGIAPQRCLGLDEGMIHVEGGLRITPLAAQHEFFDRDAQLGYPYLSYVVELGGVTLFHSGDTLCYDGQLAKLQGWAFDLFFLPINGRDAARFARNCAGNMTFQEAVDLAGTLRPRLAVPGHYDMFANNSANPQDFADYMRAKYPAQAFWLGEHGEKVVLPPRK